MKEDLNIDELLNSFIDGELTARQHTEVQRLIIHDARVAKRLRELEKCKKLVGSLPRAEAPAEILEEVKVSLERRAVLGRQPSVFEEQAGARQLLVRKVLSAAAMIGLVAVLVGVIYTIVGPEGGAEKPVVSEDWRRPVKKIEVEKSLPRLVATAEKPIDKASLPALATDRGTRFNGRLELKTSSLIAVDAVITRAIEDKGLLEYSSPRIQGDKRVHAFSCGRETLGSLLADLEDVWQRFDSATLFVETGQAGGEVVVGGVTPEQVAEIANRDSLESRIKVAKDFAVLNEVTELLPGKEILAAIDCTRGDLITIPKPVLTSAVGRPHRVIRTAETEKEIKEPTSRSRREEQVHLTIVVAGGE